MKKKLARQISCILMCLVMLVGILPATVHADYEDGMECWHCGHYHYDSWCCDQCGACSIDDDNSECFTDTHCNECGACFQNTVFCLECMACENCYVNEGWHCLGCGECYVDRQDELCGYCWFCADCMGGLCDGCGFCEGCWELELMHCQECGNCYGAYDICQYGYLHCEECCVLCEQCDECLYEDGIELCEDCGLCVYCCLDNAAAEGCECGEYCLENPDWYEHVCPDCGNPFCSVDMCEYCELCLDCCEGNSECSGTPPICVEDDEYEFHFCEDCGDCFHNSYVCESCEAAGTQLCEECCRIRLEEEGCNCSDRCISDSDIEEHIASAHANAGGSHTATPKSDWEMNENEHWRMCRYCDDAGHITGKGAHTYDKYGICTSCGYDSQKVILILKQPKSTVATVSDIHFSYEDDPLHPFNNMRTFTVAAKGTTKLQYQWYVTYGDGTWYKLKNDTDEGTIAYVSGADTNTLTVAVPIDGCVYQPAYKCVITDQLGNEISSNLAYMKIQHAYRKYQTSYGEIKGYIHQPNPKDTITRYESEGHFTICVGEMCEEYKLVPHTFSKQSRYVVDSKTNVGWHERTCIHCGYKTYLENHIHYFYDPVTFECDVDTTYKNPNQHKLKCLWPGCDHTYLESHDMMGWQNHGTPYSNADHVGVAYQECQICGYSSSKKLQTYDETQDKMVDSQWTQLNDLVYVEHGYSSCDTVINGTTIVIGFAPSDYARMESFETEFPTVTGWKVRYYCNRSPAGSTVDMDVTEYFSFERINNELKWKVTIPLFPGRQGGGIIIFSPILDKCKHNGTTRIVNASEPICTQDGYTGDTVCADCGGVISFGRVIESVGRHEGNLTLIPGTSREGSCEQKGYEGTYRCDHCNKTVKGKTTSKVHNAPTVVKNYVAFTCTEFGYSGDIYCECGALLQEGTYTEPRHTNLKLVNEADPSCKARGYTGDWKCFDCNQIVKYGYNTPKGSHVWTNYTKVDELYHSHTCTVSGCGTKELSMHTDFNRDLTCDGCGYTWGNYQYVIRDIVFNIDVPAIGSKPDYTAFTSEYFWSEGTGAHKKNGIEWLDVTDNQRFTPGGVDQTYKEGHVYKVTIHFRCNMDFIFTDEGSMTASINGREAAVEYVTYGEFAGISYTFEALEHQHTISRVNRVSPTCENDGKQTYYRCDTCGISFEDAAGGKVITDLPNWGILPAKGHVESELKSNSTHHFKVCTRCFKEIDGSKAAHSGGTATCVNKAKCEVCGTPYGGLADHDLATEVWGFIDGLGHAHMCLTEDCYYRDELLPHRSSGPATDDVDEICLDCGYVMTKAPNHKHKPKGGYDSDDDRHWLICICGEPMNDEPHKDKNGDGVCDICGHSCTPGEQGSGCWILWLIIILFFILGILAALVLIQLKKKRSETNSENHNKTQEV